MAVQRQRPGEIHDIVRRLDDRTFDVTIASGTYRIMMPEGFRYPADRRGIQLLDESLLQAARNIESSSGRRLSEITPKVRVSVQPVEILSVVTPRRGMPSIEAFYRSEGGRKADRILRDLLREIYPETGGAGSMVRWAFGENAGRRPSPSEEGMQELRAAFYYLLTSTALHDIAALRANGIESFTQVGGGAMRVEIDAGRARAFLRSWILEYSSERTPREV